MPLANWTLSKTSSTQDKMVPNIVQSILLPMSDQTVKPCGMINMLLVAKSQVSFVMYGISCVKKLVQLQKNKSCYSYQISVHVLIKDIHFSQKVQVPAHCCKLNNHSWCFNWNVIATKRIDVFHPVLYFICSFSQVNPSAVKQIVAILYKADQYLYDLLLLNAILDPIIYAIRMREVRFGYMRLFWVCLGRYYKGRERSFSTDVSVMYSACADRRVSRLSMNSVRLLENTRRMSMSNGRVPNGRNKRASPERGACALWTRCAGGI